MNKKWQIVLSGAGGQGLILAGTILGEAAVLVEGKNAVQTAAYGVESRGGFSKSEVVISDEDIAYPQVIKADLVLALIQMAYDRYRGKLPADCIFVYDSSEVENPAELPGAVYGYPFTELARSAGNVAVAKMVALGAVVALTGAVPAGSLDQVMSEKFARRPLNQKAFKIGLDLVK